MKEKGYIHIYYGDGKGKTTAAAGLCVRAAGSGLRVWIVQFLKDGSTGERKVLEKLEEVTWEPGYPVTKFTFQMSPQEKEETKQQCCSLLEKVRREMEDYDVVVLDEVLYAVRSQLVEEQSLCAVMEAKPEYTELVLTGNYLSEALEERADYVTRMEKRKHPFDRGITARAGIEK